MTLVAVTYNPPRHSSFNHSNKWKKGLVSLFTNKFNYSSGRRYSSPTTVAAATEKVLRHMDNNNNNNESMIKCEDLTAKEFAQMAGIKIKEQEQDIDHDLTQMTSITAFSSKSSPNKSIWDSDFWQCNDGDKKCTNDTQSLTVPSCNYSIQKGRFKICVGQVDSEPVHQHQQTVLEWKRKRSDSSSAKKKQK
ncbi:uncharacterized protein RHIMIDRAFT_5850 [Rhizopus microsporus ATCC 52813]|uniref:Uncharacterized protein n=2 Tax=Rhizopus microsporus TaxID=58291 RepID=A0A2G4T8J2_RHIZD|nr:uncharacterized protein RHIMIDRAFT_5850 [Rhizopus microsporus ATCC 52813]PHZ17307.1 hypothetical protein RHIMIDRAFT_5850 [Rhizopus microsporus ATCC 52813]